MPLVYLALLSIAWPYSLVSSATANDDGASLLSAMGSWQVNFTSWVGSDPCQQWQGVACNTDNRVISLSLPNQGLVGPIPQEIGNLEYLGALDLSNSGKENASVNQITGNLSALQGLTNLQTFLLDLNGMPRTDLLNIWNVDTVRICLNLSFNPIQLDTFPTVIFTLVNLVALKIDNTRIKGQLPKELAQLTKLEYMYLANNSFSGPLPPEFSNLIHLREISLWNNNLDSKIPPEYGNLVNLTYMNFHECNLYGGLPVELGRLNKMKNISLYGNKLTGNIPDSWSNMSQLYNLWLHRNSLTKYVPQWLIQLPNLFNVSLDYNFFYGTFPNFTNTSVEYVSLTCNYLSGTSPVLPANLVFNSSGNCFTPINENNKIRCQQSYYNCETFFNQVPDGTCPSCPSSDEVVQDESTCVCDIATTGSGSKTSVLIGALVGAGAFILLLAFSLWIWLRTRARKYRNDYDDPQGPIYDGWEGPESVARFSIQDIAIATKDFSAEHEIGVGGFGKVFYGVLDGKEVAIKRAHQSSIQTSSGFRNEILLLSRLHHRNLVRLVGFCEEKGIQILVYEYMSNGNLHTMLFKSSTNLNWLMRLDIAIGVAQGLEYLHSFADPPVIHRDVKPSNILLDGNMVAKLADFGISKVAPEFEEHLATRPAGTVGYIDPQYVLREELTTASDVYSFGMVLLEIISGQKSVDNKRTDDRNLIEWTKLKMSTRGLEHVVDPRLEDDYPKGIYRDMVKLAIDCASFNSEDRPSMKAVLTILDACRWSVLKEYNDGQKGVREQTTPDSAQSTSA